MTPQRYLELVEHQQRIAARGSVRSDEINRLVAWLGEALTAIGGEDDAAPARRVGLQFVLPYPESTNRIWQNARRFAKADELGERKVYMGRKLSPAAEKYKNDVIGLVRDGGRPKVPPGLLRLTFHLFPPDARHRDADNGIKLAQDAVAAGLGIDDYRVVSVEVRRRLPAPRKPRLVVLVESDPSTAFTSTGGKP